jgi:hypothetical protein
MRLRLPIVMLLNRSIVREAPLVVFKIFKGSFEFQEMLKAVKRNAVYQRKGMEIVMF